MMMDACINPTVRKVDEPTLHTRPPLRAGHVVCSGMPSSSPAAPGHRSKRGERHSNHSNHVEHLGTALIYLPRTVGRICRACILHGVANSHTDPPLTTAIFDARAQILGQEHLVRCGSHRKLNWLAASDQHTPDQFRMLRLLYAGSEYYEVRLLKATFSTHQAYINTNTMPLH